MQFDDKTFKLPDTQYYKEKHQKKKIVLHFTAGHNAQGAYNHFLSTKTREGTSYVIGPDGQIYELFDPSYWALHLFQHKPKDPYAEMKYKLEKQTIGIEIVNPGPLSLGLKEHDKNTLYTYYKKEWCDLLEPQKFVQQEYRGHYFWATFTGSQYSSLVFLIPHLCDLYGIDMYTSGLTADRNEYWGLSSLLHYRGITTHANYRRDKLDIGPAFNWSKIGIHG